MYRAETALKFKGPDYMKYGFLATLASITGSLVIIGVGWPAAKESTVIAALLGLLSSLWTLSGTIMSLGKRWGGYLYVLLSFAFLEWRALTVHQGENLIEWLASFTLASIIFLLAIFLTVKWWRSLPKTYSHQGVAPGGLGG